MKTINNLIVLTNLFLVITMSLSCTKNEENQKNTVTEQISRSLKSGSWSVTKFKKNEIDNTLIFSKVTFIFQSNNITLSIDSTNTSFNGTLSIRRIPTADDEEEEDEEDDGLDHGNNTPIGGNLTVNNQVFSVDNLEIIFNYNYTNQLINLNNKWKIIFQSESKIELVNYNNLNSIDTYLILSKKPN